MEEHRLTAGPQDSTGVRSHRVPNRKPGRSRDTT